MTRKEAYSRLKERERFLLKKALLFYIENNKLKMSDELLCIETYKKINDKNEDNRGDN